MIVYHELSSIETDLNVRAKTLYCVSNNISAHYQTVEIPKRNGDTRKLLVPSHVLKYIQRAIAEKLLSLEPVSQYATAYKEHTDITANAKPHINKNRVIKLDIYRFFDSISYSTVKEKAFPAYRYSENLRVLLTMLCYYKDVLPQGAPTSPAISNIIMFDFDNKLGAWCKAHQIAYTRYCDDLTFSGNIDTNTQNALLTYVQESLKELGFVLNRNKTKIAHKGQQQNVTGLVVNEKLNISSDYKRTIRQEVYFCKKHGVKSHLQATNDTRQPQEYLSSLLGRINHVLHICPNNKEFAKYKTTVLGLTQEYYRE